MRGPNASPIEDESPPIVPGVGSRLTKVRRDQILDLAAARFAMAGYSGTSLQAIAEAGGILPGSLYHHFDSKEAIARELVRHYHSELDAIGRAALEQRQHALPASIYEDLLGLTMAVAECSIRHRAAVRLSIYESAAGELQVGEPQDGGPAAIDQAIEQILRRGRDAGLIRSPVSSQVSAQQISTTMRRIGVSNTRQTTLVPELVTTLLHILLGGLASNNPADANLDRSDALRAAKGPLEAWRSEARRSSEDKVATLYSAARFEFARQGYEAATMRGIAQAAGISMGVLYRIVDSKETLLQTIMSTYYTRLSTAYEAVLASGSSVTEQIDGLIWVNINSMELFGAEFEIQHSWIREIPPAADISSTAWSRQIEQTQSLILRGLRSSELRVWKIGPVPPPAETVIASVLNLIWFPSGIIDGRACRSALRHSRQTILRGMGSRRLAKVIERRPA